LRKELSHPSFWGEKKGEDSSVIEVSSIAVEIDKLLQETLLLRFLWQFFRSELLGELLVLGIF
jgi:hypothetical protein